VIIRLVGNIIFRLKGLITESTHAAIKCQYNKGDIIGWEDPCPSGIGNTLKSLMKTRKKEASSLKVFILKSL